MATPFPQNSQEQIPESQQPQIIAAAIVTGTIAVIALFLRFLAKTMVKAPLWLDDLAVAIALLFAWAEAGVTLSALPLGLGRHINELAPEDLQTFLAGLFATQILYRFSILFAKYSLLALFWRLFRKKRYARTSIIILFSGITAWGFAVIAATIFQCVPIQKFWNRPLPGVCNVNAYAYFAGTSITNTVTDIALLLLPLPIVWRLNTTAPQKIGLTITFLLGGVVIIISIVRLAVVSRSNFDSMDVTWSYTPVALWSLIEMNTAVICACLVSLRPLLAFFTQGYVRIANRWTGKGQGSISRQDTIDNSPARRRVSSRSDSDELKMPTKLLDIDSLSGDMGSRTVIGVGRRSSFQLSSAIRVEQEIIVR